MNKYFIIDFDSTFTQVEALDVLGEVSLATDPNRENKLREIRQVTDLGMNGELSFTQSLERRLELLQAHRDHLPPLIERLRTQVSPSVERNREFFHRFADRIYIISNGFREFILPIVSEFGVKPENVLANSFVFDEAGRIVDFDRQNPLSANQGKVEIIRTLNLPPGEIIVVGDGYTDYEIREAGLADTFYAFTENVERSRVLEKADHIAPSFDEFLYHNRLAARYTYPKNRIRVLLLENIHPRAEALFRQEGYQVETVKGALDEAELAERIRDVSLLGLRSKTQLTASVLANANRLLAVGAFCIGTNQIDLTACTAKGVVAFNAPFSNTRSVVELAIGEIISLLRNVSDKSRAMHQGQWDKSAANSFEIRGKKLGIVGYGNIGSQLSVLAEALGLEVYYYDVVEKLALGNARKCRSLAELLALADIVSLHVDGRPENHHLIGVAELASMKEKVILLNLSRGHVVDLAALAAAIRRGQVIGAGVDVFPEEPKTNDEEFASELRGLPNVILTPHIGGSTEEAQENIAAFVPERLMAFVNRGDTFFSVNFPNLQLPELSGAHRLIHIHQNVPGILARINGVLAEHGLNILGQYLKTNEQIGYVITDIDRQYGREAIAALKAIPHTIRFRMLY